MAKLKVAVLMGGKSPEHEVSLVTGRGVVENLDKEKYEVVPITIPKETNDLEFLDLSPPPDLFFIALHGPFGEDGTIQGILDFLGYKYTGSGVLASALGMNKIMFKKVIKQENIPTPNWIVLNKSETILDEKLNKIGPSWVVKPSSQGSSVGINIVNKQKELKKALDKAFEFDNQVLVEEYIDGIEVSCGLLGNDNPRALPVIEICPKTEFFDYQAKYNAEKCEEIVPARISDQLTEKVQDLAKRVYRTINCCGFGRVDMIIKDNHPYVLEINTIPGLTPTSLLPQEAKAAGISYSKLLDKVIEFSLSKNS
jgi:D-alanine-D-alanine ligase